MKKVYSILLLLIAVSCSDKYIIINHNDLPSERKMNLMVVNNDAVTVGSNSIANLQILMFDKDGKCMRVFAKENVVFDEKNIFATTLTIPRTTTSVTVLANAIGYTYPSQQLFSGMTLENIFLSTPPTVKLPANYYPQPKVFFEGTAAVKEAESDADVIKVNVGISRVISKIVVNLSGKLSFTANGGKGFSAVNSSQNIYINGIDSLFVVDTPPGINLTQTQYMGDRIGFNACQIYKVADFKPYENSSFADEIDVFPQINAPYLPFIILSVTGTKGFQQIDKHNPLYYGMRIKNVTFPTGSIAPLESLPRNVVIVVTINDFSGVGSSQHPNPDYLNTLDVSVDVKSWSEYYSAIGNVE